MAPTALTVEWQTTEIIRCLLDDDDDPQSRQLTCCSADVETDGQSDDDNFDPVLIADKLKSVADALNEDMKFKAALSDLKQAVAEEAMEQAFSQGVKALCQTQVSLGAEVTPEMQLIKASVTIGLYIKKSSPELKSKIQRAMTAFLTRHVGQWVTQQGGWDKVNV